MTVIKLSSGVSFFIRRPNSTTKPESALNAIGEVRTVVAPSRAHHLSVGDYMKTWPNAKLYGPPGLVGDIPDFRARIGARRDLKLDGVLGDEPESEWAGEIDQHLFKGAAGINEVVFFHRPTRIRNFHRPGLQRARGLQGRWLFYWIVGARGQFGPHLLIRLSIRDRKAARKTRRENPRVDFDRVIITHGDVSNPTATQSRPARRTRMCNFLSCDFSSCDFPS